jgi:3-oxoacyl-[acyl-carrier protein] reductase
VKHKENHQMTEPSPISVITGASNGIGSAIARRLYARGDNVILVARRADLLEKLAGELGDRAEISPVDLTVPSDVAKVTGEIMGRHPVVDSLVNCAGSRPDRILTSTPFDRNVELWNEQIAVNLTSAFHITYALAQSIRRPGGRIVNIGSVAAQTGGRRPGSAGYAAAKAGLHGLTLALSRELAPSGITCNTVEPGFVAGTGFTGSWGSEMTDPLIADTPAGRAGLPDDIADAVDFLTSSSASFITGQAMAVNGGMVTN